MELISDHSDTKIEDVFSSKGRIKIIKTLVLKKETNISNLVHITKLNHNSVKEHLESLCEAGLIEEKWREATLSVSFSVILPFCPPFCHWSGFAGHFAATGLLTFDEPFQIRDLFIG